MGVVFQAWDRRLERHVALKILSFDEQPSGSRPKAVAELFLQEAKAVARLNHPNIVTLYDIGGSKGRYFLVMEYVEGYNLEVMQKQHKRVPQELVLNIGCQLCDALDYAHRQGIIHRDIKPANVLLNGEGGIKLMDFGIARIQRKSEPQGPEEQWLGSLLYMPPEQLVDAANADHRADLYALGVTLYELMCGAKPFQHDSIPQLIRQIMAAEVPSFAAFGVRTAPALEEVIRKALNKDPAERFQSAAEMGQALNALKDQSLEPDLIGCENKFVPGYADQMPQRADLYAYVESLLAS
jgi:serine/threonine-protein kinase